VSLKHCLLSHHESRPLVEVGCVLCVYLERGGLLGWGESRELVGRLLKQLLTSESKRRRRNTKEGTRQDGSGNKKGVARLSSRLSPLSSGAHYRGERKKLTTTKGVNQLWKSVLT